MKINDEELCALTWWIEWTSDYMEEKVRHWEYKSQVNAIDPKTVVWEKHALNTIQKLNTRIINKLRTSTTNEAN